MAKLFGYPINVEADGGSSAANAEASRSVTQRDVEAASLSAGSPRRETNPYPRFPETRSGPMDSRSDPDNNSFIDFFGRESREIETQRIASDAVDICGGGFDDVMEVQLGLGIGAASSGGDSVITAGKETGPGRVGAGADLTPLGDDLEGSMGVTPFEDDLFCEDEAMLMADDDDEVVELENFLNGGITLESEPVQPSLFTRVEEEEEEEEEGEEEEVSELPLPPVNDGGLVEPVQPSLFTRVELEEEDIDEIPPGLFEDSSIMDIDAEFFLAFFDEAGETNHGDYSDVFAESFNQVPPPRQVMRTRPASKRVVDELPVVEITSEELSRGKIVCAICIGDVVAEGKKVTRLPCWHYYHGECIVPWLARKNTCPVCRYQLPTDDVL